MQRSELSAATQVAVAIAMSGARLDLGQTEAALDELDIAQLNPNVAYSYSADLFAAYADVLEDLGREAEAETWRGHAARADAALGEDEGDLIEVFEEDIVFDSVDEAIASGALSHADTATTPAGSRTMKLFTSRRRSVATPLDGVDAVLADLDGVVYQGPTAIAFAVEALGRAASEGLRIGYITNNASRTDVQVAEHLASFGLNVVARDVVTSPRLPCACSQTSSRLAR